MTILDAPAAKEYLLAEHNRCFPTMIKAVVDIERRIIALEAELHADLEAALLENGSLQENLWGINLYLRKDKPDWIEYTSLINIRPSVGNCGLEIEETGVREKIACVVFKLITP